MNLEAEDIFMNKRIAIYGAGHYGQRIFDYINGIESVNVVLVCDSDRSMWGKRIDDQFVVQSPETLVGNDNIDAVFIAVNGDGEKEVEEFILEKTNLHIYHHENEIAASSIYWDISGVCNAQCRYCSTGRKNRLNIKRQCSNTYMRYDDFVNYYLHLYKCGILSKKSNLCLYNWYEPFMNPDIMDILMFLSKCEQNYTLSTNCTVFRKAKEITCYTYCKKIIFSMCGFSQNSYDRIHYGLFSLDKIKENIIKFKHDMLTNGFCGEFEIAAHKYRFNREELKELKIWAADNDMNLREYCAYLNGNVLNEDYFENRYNSETYEDIKNDFLFSWNIDNKDRPEGIYDWICNNITIDASGRRTLCNYADEFRDDYDSWGSILDITSYEDILKQREIMLGSKSCIKCKKYQIAYRIYDLVNSHG